MLHTLLYVSNFHQRLFSDYSIQNIISYSKNDAANINILLNTTKFISIKIFSPFCNLYYFITYLCAIKLKFICLKKIYP